MNGELSDIYNGFGLSSVPNEYVLGTFDKRPTVFDQQIRALNLAFRMACANKIPSDKPIAVIGAGIAGVTFAAGCLWLGQKVLLLERQPVPFHLQRGCDIRWIHPHIYHWPKQGADRPHAGLPLLTWVEGTASDVVRQIATQWSRFASIATKLGTLREVYQATINRAAGENLKLEWTGCVQSVDSNPSKKTLIEEFSSIVFAVGFGVESTLHDIDGHSYWINDSFNQLPPDHPPDTKDRWLVSGMGDGGLIDLQRLTIENFRQNQVVDELFDGRDKLISHLRERLKSVLVLI